MVDENFQEQTAQNAERFGRFPETAELFPELAKVAASGDLIATHFNLAVNDVLYWLRALYFLGPILAFMITRRICLALQRKDREIVLHGRETGRVQQLPHGEFIEVHEPLDEYKRYRLVNMPDYQVEPAQPNAKGKITATEKTRERISRFFFEDRVAPVTPAELEGKPALFDHGGPEHDLALRLLQAPEVRQDARRDAHRCRRERRARNHGRKRVQTLSRRRRVHD